MLDAGRKQRSTIWTCVPISASGISHLFYTFWTKTLCNLLDITSEYFLHILSLRTLSLCMSCLTWNHMFVSCYNARNKEQYSSTKTLGYVTAVLSIVNIFYTGTISIVIVGMTIGLYCSESQLFRDCDKIKNTFSSIFLNSHRRLQDP